MVMETLQLVSAYLMPWVAPALGIGFYSLLKKPRTKPFLIGLLLYAALFHLIALWSH